VSSKKNTPEKVFPDYRKVANRAVEAALKAGADQADAYVSCGKKTSIKVRKGDVEELTQAGSKAMGIRVLVGGRGAILHTSDFDARAVRKLAKQAVTLAGHSGADSFAAIPDYKAPRKDPAEKLDLFDLALLEDPMENKIDRARRCEAAAEAVSKKIQNTQGTGYNEGLGAVVLVSSNGFSGRYQGTYCGLSTVPIAVSGGKRQTDYWSAQARFLADLDSPEEVGRIAAERSLSRLGGKIPKTEELPVVFDPPSAGTIVSHFASACFGSAVFREASFLRDQLGKSVAPTDFHLTDDPLLARGLGSRPFDGEGLPSKKNRLIHKGVLKRFLTNSYAARKLKKALTHSASRSFGSTPGVGTTNLFLEAGPHSPEEILSSIKKGIYVTSFMGHGVNLVTGDYSRGATGFLIENGELKGPLQGFTIACNLGKMLQHISMIGNDLEFRGSTNAPTIKVQSMMVSGK
jgi:PmbA protein